MNLDWTAIALTALTGVMGLVTWAAKRFSARLDRHMERVDGFMGDAREHRATTNVRLDNAERRQNDFERRLNSAQQIGEIHDMVTDMKGRGCGQTSC